jgi:hypothetical protein
MSYLIEDLKFDIFVKSKYKKRNIFQLSGYYDQKVNLEYLISHVSKVYGSEKLALVMSE